MATPWQGLRSKHRNWCKFAVKMKKKRKQYFIYMVTDSGTRRTFQNVFTFVKNA